MSLELYYYCPPRRTNRNNLPQLSSSPPLLWLLWLVCLATTSTLDASAFPIIQTTTTSSSSPRTANTPHAPLYQTRTPAKKCSTTGDAVATTTTDPNVARATSFLQEFETAWNQRDEDASRRLVEEYFVQDDDNDDDNDNDNDIITPPCFWRDMVAFTCHFDMPLSLALNMMRLSLRTRIRKRRNVCQRMWWCMPLDLILWINGSQNYVEKISPKR
jgi:hypothetical protein